MQSSLQRLRSSQPIYTVYFSYADKLRAVAAASVSNVKKPVAASSPARKPASPARKPTNTTPHQSPAAVARKSNNTDVAASIQPAGKPCPASRKVGAAATPGGGAGNAGLGSPRRSSVLPKGWRSETRTVNAKEVLVYFSPDGREFPVEYSILAIISYCTF